MPLRPSEARAPNLVLAAALTACEIFSGAGADDLAEIAQFSRLQNFAKGEYLFREGDPAIGFYIVQRASINVHRSGPDGNEHVLHIFNAADSFAEAALASPTGYPAHARAIRPSTVILIPKTEILEFIKRRPELALRMLGAMSHHLRSLVSRFDDLSLRDTETRLAYWLIKKCPQPLTSRAVEVLLPGTKRLLAAELRTTPETLSRMMGILRSKKLISTRGRIVSIPNPLALQAALEPLLTGGANPGPAPKKN